MATLLPLILLSRTLPTKTPPGQPIPDNGSRGMLLVNIFLPFTALLFVTSRFVVKWSFRQTFGADDLAIGTSMGFAVAQSVLQCLETKYGFGKHGVDIPRDHLRTALKLFLAVQVTYKTSITLTKISILLLYRRIFVIPRFIRVVWCLITFCAVFGFASTLVTIFQCIPVRKAYDRSVPGTCVDLTILWFVDGVTFIVSDVTILLLPIPVINSLRLGRRSKLVLMLVFAVGGFVCITSILRLTTLKQGSEIHDPTWDAVTANVWSCVETNVGIVCACMPMLRAPLAVLFPKLLSTTSDNSNDRKPSQDRISKTPKSSFGRYRSANLTFGTMDDSSEGLCGVSKGAEITVEGVNMGSIRDIEDGMAGIRSTPEIHVVHEEQKSKGAVPIGSTRAHVCHMPSCVVSR